MHFYFSERLIKKMDEILNYPLTVLKAGSGYGKTTAVKELFFKRQAAAYRQLTYTCFGESAAASWKGICQKLEQIDPQIGQYLASLEIPDAEVLGDIASQIQALSCACDTILCIDNFQLFAIDVKDRLIEALSLHRCGNLHIVILTQPLKQEITGFSYHLISAPDLILDRQDVNAYFEQAGQPIAEATLDQLMTTTGGYIAALKLQLDSLRQTGRCESAATISALMDYVLWRHLEQKEKGCLLCLSLFSSFTVHEGVQASGWDGEALRKFLKSNDFIAYDKTIRKYVFHHLLLTYLKEIFNGLKASDQAYFFKRAAQAEKAAGNPVQAAFFFAQCHDFESIFRLSFQSGDRIGLIEMENGRIVEELIQPECRKFLKLNPELILTLTLELFVQGKIILFSQYLEQVRALLLTADDYPLARRNRLLGEYALMESFFRFNDIEQMCLCHRRAYQYLKGPTRLYSLNTAWTFGIPSVVCMFWRELGKVRVELSQLAEGLPAYHQLSCGNGLGAAQAMAGEIALLAGDEETALRYYKEALFEAERLKQDSICYCAYLGMSKIALLQGNATSYVHMREKIEDLAYLGKESRNVYTTGLCQGCLALLLEQFDEAPEWLSRKEGIQSRSLAIALPFAHILYAGLLLKQTKEHQISLKQFTEEIEKLILESRRMNMLLPQVYYSIDLAIAADRSGDRKEAAVQLAAAMALAEKDQVYLPFAENYAQIKAILESLVLDEKRRPFREAVSSLGMKFQSGRSAIWNAMNVKKARLTPRELEIAGLLKQRYSVKEIAARLMISPSTVSNTMQSLYAKLGIHSKRELYQRTDL